MHRVHRSGRDELRLAPILALALASIPTEDALARSVHVLAFNAPPNAAYDANLNGTTRQTIASTQSGTLEYAFDASDNDLVSFNPADLAPPPAPIVTSVIPDGAGCALATWLPSGDPTVVGYVIYAGTRSVAGGAASHYDVSLDTGSASSIALCSLPPGPNYVAVRARNYAGVLSAYSAEQTVIITTVAVLFSSLDADVQDNGILLTWDVETDEVVEGYRVYRQEEGEPETALMDDALPAATRTFLDAEAQSATSYSYVLGAQREDGSEIRSAPVEVETPQLELALGQNAPNPFNPSTQIAFTLDKATRAVLRVYDVHGRLVATLADESMGEGRHTVAWDGRDANGAPVATGIYVYALTADRRTISKKMTLLK